MADRRVVAVDGDRAVPDAVPGAEVAQHLRQPDARAVRARDPALHREQQHDDDARERDDEQRVAAGTPQPQRRLEPHLSALARRCACAVISPAGLRATTVTMSPRSTPTVRSPNAPREGARDALGRAAVAAEAGDGVGDAHDAAVARDLDDLEAAAAQQLAERAAREVDEVHLHVPGPEAAGDAREERVDVHRRDGEHAARAKRRVHGAQRARRVGQVLDDVPHRDDVVGALGQRRVLDDADVHGPAHARLGPLGGPARGLDARDLEAGLLGQLDERADVAADVEQAAGGREAAHVGEAVGERRDAPLLLLDVAHVLDVAVGVLHREVVRARVHVDDPARAALDDAPEAAELARGRRVVALRVDRPRSGSSRSARGSGRHRTAGSARRPRCGRSARLRRGGRRRARLGFAATWPRILRGPSRRVTRRRRAAHRVYSRLVRVADHPRERPAWWALAAAALASFILHIPFLTTPLSVDEGGYGYVARWWASGADLYGDVWVDRPQGLLLLYRWAEALPGSDRARHPPDGGALVVRHRRRARAADHEPGGPPRRSGRRAAQRAALDARP